MFSAVFAGLTSVIARKGLAGISGELGLSIRTVWVCLFVGVFALVAVPRESLALVSRSNLW